MLDNLADSLNNGNIMANPSKFYHQQHIQRANRPLSNLSDALVELGQLQLLRKSIALSFGVCVKLRFEIVTLGHKNVKRVRSHLIILLNLLIYARFENRCVVEEEKLELLHHGEEGSHKTSILAAELSPFLSFCGLTDPDQQIYVDGKPGPRLPELIFLVIISTLSKLQFSPNTGDLIAKKPNELLDGHPFAVGTACLLRQYPDEIFNKVVEYLAQYIRSFCVELTR